MMGMANMDFVIRECQAVVNGPLAIIRLGTCGALQPPAHLGCFLVASEGSVCVRCVTCPVADKLLLCGTPSLWRSAIYLNSNAPLLAISLLPRITFFCSAATMYSHELTSAHDALHATFQPQGATCIFR